MGTFIDDEEAKALQEAGKAVQELAKTGGKAIDAGRAVGAFLARVFGTVPEDLAGIAFGDYLHQARMRHVAKMAAKTARILEERKVAKPRPVSQRVALPLLAAAADESDDELQELWARLLANAVDPTRGDVRVSFIETLKRLEPIDARVLHELGQQKDHGNQPVDPTVKILTALISRSRRDEILVSLNHLHQLGCVDTIQSHWYLQPFGRELLLACAE